MAKSPTLRKPSPNAAYLVADGATAEEAEANGLVVVESDPHGLPLSYGKYEDAAPASDE
jgi:hypothetical protein